MIRDIFDLSGQKAIVTGGGSGIGKHLCKILDSCGVQVAVVDINEDAAHETKNELDNISRKHTYYKCDVSEPESVNMTINSIYNEFERFDILINNAGINITKPTLDLTKSEWQNVINTNLNSIFYVSQSVGKYMIEHKYGKILNIASIFGIITSQMHYAIAYNTAKAGVINFTRSLATEWALHNIYVNALAPGMIKTALTEHRFSDKEYYNKWISNIPLNRLGTVNDLSGPCIFLISKASNYVTGHTLVVDGGYISW